MAAHRAPVGVTLHRFFLPASCFVRDDVRFPADVSRQMERVLRLRVGDRIVALDGTGAETVVRLIQVGSQTLGAVEDRRLNSAEAGARITLYQGLLKGPKLETVLQKCTEVGISRFVPIHTARSVPSDINADRLVRFKTIAREAAEQSRRGLLPDVESPMSLADALRHASTATPMIFLWEGETAVRLRDLRLAGASSASLFVGPEGGFTSEEAEDAGRAGADIVTLGPRILRAETAAIIGAALLLAGTGDIG